MKTIAILFICFLLAATAACAPSSAANVSPSATPSLVPMTEPTATRVPMTAPTVTRAAQPTFIPIVEEGVGKVATTLELPNLGGLFPAVGAGSVWVPGQGLLARIDPATREVVSTITLDGGKHVPGPYAVAIEGDSIWATELANKALVRIDPGTNEIVDRIELNVEGELHALALDGSTLWIAIRGADQVLQVETAARQIIRSIPIDDPTSIAIGEGSVWVVEHHKGNLVRIDPNTGSVVARIQVRKGTGSPGQVAVGEGGVWVGLIDGQTVSRVDPQTNQETAQIELGLLVFSVKTSPGAVWAVVGPSEGCQASGVVRIDPHTNKVLGRIPVRCAADIAVGPDRLWITSQQYKEITVVTPAQ